MDWAQVLIIIGSNIVLMLVMFGMTLTLHLHTDKKIEAIQQEMKDFHRRLCDIEANRDK